MKDTKSLGALIRAKRKSLNMTQKELAKKLGKVESSIRMWELGKNKPSPEVLEKLSGTLAIDYSLLLQEAGYEELASIAKYKEAVEEFTKADPKNAEILNEIKGPASPENFRKLSLILENIKWQDNNTPIAQINEGDTEYKAKGFFDLKEVLEKYPSLSYGEKILSLSEREKVKTMLEVLFRKE